VKKHLQYAKYLARHKWFVFLAGLNTRAPLWRLIVHDWSKFMPCEWRPYAHFFYGLRPRSQRNRCSLCGASRIPGGACSFVECRNPLYDNSIEAAAGAAFGHAWLHHQHFNPHHWQHWVLREDSGATKILEMPLHLVREMVADWMGAGRAITGRWGAKGWYLDNCAKIQLAQRTRAQVHELLDISGELAIEVWQKVRSAGDRHPPAGVSQTTAPKAEAAGRNQ
jgi:hypothetical protein